MRVLLLVGIVIVAFNLRPSITSVTPILEVIKAELGTSYTVTSLLTTIPTLSFGVFAFAAVAVSRLLGRERGVLLMIILIGIGTAMRIWGTYAPVLFASTIVVGFGIAVTQTLLPSIVNSYFSDQAALITGLYTTSLLMGAAIASGFTVPLYEYFGSWTVALSAWAIISVLGIVIWAPIAIRASAADRDVQSKEQHQNSEKKSAGLIRILSKFPWHSSTVWLILILFVGQGVFFYSLLTWLPPLYVSLGWGVERAGYLLTVFITANLGGTFIIAPLSDYWVDRRPWLGLASIMCVIGLMGLSFAPMMFPWMWSSLLGIGVGSIFALSLTLPVDYAPDPDAADRLTSIITGIGYILIAVGPFAVGAIRDVSGGYQFSLLVMTIFSIVLLIATVFLRPDRSITPL
jgi:CP family cyanate transporter-like MFS transporter